LNIIIWVLRNIQESQNISAGTTTKKERKKETKQKKSVFKFGGIPTTICDGVE